MRCCFGVHAGPGAFYRLMPHNAIAALFDGAFLYAILAIAMGVRAFWREAEAAYPLEVDDNSIWQAIRDAASLRYLDGGRAGCVHDDEQPDDDRRLYHHFAFYGFGLSLAATCVVTLYHYLLGREAPYPWYDLPVLLGTVGGFGLVIGPVGLLMARWRRRSELRDLGQSGMDNAFTVMLLLTSLTGLDLLVLRSTPAMSVLLALHLGVVFALFLTMPYGRFVHGAYRFAALVLYARELKQVG